MESWIGMKTYDSPIPMDETARIFGVQQTSLVSFVGRMLGSPVAQRGNMVVKLRISGAIVTGASSGIGEGIANWYLRRENHV